MQLDYKIHFHFVQQQQRSVWDERKMPFGIKNRKTGKIERFECDGTYPFVVAKLEPTGYDGLVGMWLHCRMVVVDVIVIDEIVDSIAAHTSGWRCENARFTEPTFRWTRKIGNLMSDIVMVGDESWPMAGRTAFGVVACAHWQWWRRWGWRRLALCHWLAFAVVKAKRRFINCIFVVGHSGRRVRLHLSTIWHRRLLMIIYESMIHYIRCHTTGSCAVAVQALSQKCWRRFAWTCGAVVVIGADAAAAIERSSHRRDGWCDRFIANDSLQFVQTSMWHRRWFSTLASALQQCTVIRFKFSYRSVGWCASAIWWRWWCFDGRWTIAAATATIATIKDMLNMCQ